MLRPPGEFSGVASGFNGRFDHSLDEKGRVSIPVPLREILQRDKQDTLFITNCNFDGDRCLELYLPDEWKRLEGRVAQKKSFGREIRMFQMFYIGGAHEVQVDRQGRIIVPAKLREFAGLKRDATFSAMVDRFQLWDREALDSYLKNIELIVGDPTFLEKLDL